MVTPAELAQAERGSVIAPAGCGKTDLIAAAIPFVRTGRVLILTHTHAGVRALRSRLRAKGVPRERVRVDTIAGWALDYCRAYPGMSGCTVVEPAGNEWDKVYEGAAKLLTTSAIREVVRASYVSVFVDEYQDCARIQHGLICALAEVVPCKVLGDPLQGIFGFAGATLSWSQDVETAFSPLGKLEYPWRWKNGNEDLGKWLLVVRERLLRGEPIDLRDGPLVWKQKSAEAQRATAFEMIDSKGSVVIIRKFPKQAHDLAQGLGRGYRSMEEMECKELMTFSRDMDCRSGNERALRVLGFAETCMTGLGSIQSIKKALMENRWPNTKRMTEHNRCVVDALHAVSETHDVPPIGYAMKLLESTPGARIYRLELWREARGAIEGFPTDRDSSIHTVAWARRSQSRHVDRTIDPRIVSRTHLIKGLEFDHSIVPDVDDFAGEDAAKHFYVAITRGSKSLTVLSASPMIQFECPRI